MQKLVQQEHIHSNNSYHADSLWHQSDSGISLIPRASVSFILTHLTNIAILSMSNCKEVLNPLEFTC